VRAGRLSLRPATSFYRIVGPFVDGALEVRKVEPLD
jgi:hypothetical protein